MGCCEDKDFQSSDDLPNENGSKNIREGARNNQSSESIVITVLWRRLSVFSRRGSTKPARGHVHQAKKRRNQIQEGTDEKTQG